VKRSVPAAGSRDPSVFRRHCIGLLLALPLPIAAAPFSALQLVSQAPLFGPVAAAVGDAPPAPAAQAHALELQGDEPLAQYLILRFMDGHPDLFWRLRGREFLARGDYLRARECFERAAYHADKPSQAMLGEMHWEGRGGPRDRALGYAWMDLAAERLYEDFYIARERYWAQLDAGERAEALRRGQPLLRKYGDEKAKKRLARVMVRKRPRGFEVGGFFGNLPIIPPSGAGRDSITLRGSEYFDDTFWEPEAYFAWQDTIWKTLHSTGRVEVGEPGAVRPSAAD
jgi:tetratricopeptide (TPR) repeat protein